jgi:hypothetical protein
MELEIQRPAENWLQTLMRWIISTVICLILCFIALVGWAIHNWWVMGLWITTTGCMFLLVKGRTDRRLLWKTLTAFTKGSSLTFLLFFVFILGFGVKYNDPFRPDLRASTEVKDNRVVQRRFEVDLGNVTYSRKGYPLDDNALAMRARKEMQREAYGRRKSAC